MKIPTPRWAQVRLNAILAMVTSQMAADDPGAAFAAALLEIGESFDEMTERVEAGAASTIDTWQRSVMALQQTMKELAAERERAEQRRARNHASLVVASIVVATAMIVTVTVSTRAPTNTCSPLDSHTENSQ